MLLTDEAYIAALQTFGISPIYTDRLYGWKLFMANNVLLGKCTHFAFAGGKATQTKRES